MKVIVIFINIVHEDCEKILQESSFSNQLFNIYIFKSNAIDQKANSLTHPRRF